MAVASTMPAERSGWTIIEKALIFLRFIGVVRNWYILPLVLIGVRRRVGSEYETRSGLRIRVRSWPINGHLSDCYAIVENFGKPKVGLVKTIRSADIVVDIGAHIGTFTLQAAQVANKVISCEPDSTNFGLLCENVQLNHARNVIPSRVAVTGMDERRRMYAGMTGATGGFFARGGDSFLVECISLSSALSRCDAEQVDLVKMDCEGAEYDILLHASVETLRKVRRFYIELHYRPGVEEQHLRLLRVLERAGFLLSQDNGRGGLIATQRGLAA